MSSKKKLRLGHIDVDPEQYALIVHYTTEIHHFDDMGNPLRYDKEPGQKVVRVRRGLTGHDIPEVADEIVEKCKYISSSKKGEVERLLYSLMETEQQQNQELEHQRQIMEMQKRREMEHQQVHQQHQPPPARRAPLLPNADVRCIDDYTNQLYDDRMELKIHGAKCILRVCTEPANLDILADHDTFLGVLSRELRENSKKSYEFAVGIICTFLCFSHFSQFHAALMQHQCGDVTMRVLEYESQRSQVRKEDMDRRIMRLQELGDAATKEDKKLLQKDQKKYNAQIARQSKLMCVCLMTLLNIAEEISVEKKMVNRNMAQLLFNLLDRESEDLLLVTLLFLKKLSIFEENKDKLVAPETLARLAHCAQHPHQGVSLLALRVIYNLSFDEGVRLSLNESGILRLLVDRLKEPPFRHIVLRLLYHFSMDDSCKGMMAFLREGMLMLLQLVVHFPEPRVGKDLVALVVNLATHPRAADVMVGSGLFPQIVLRVLKTRDPLLMKVVRHVSSHKDVVEPMCELLAADSARMNKWMSEYVRMAMCSVDNPDVLLEVLGTLANIALPDAPWGELCEAGLVDLITRLLVPSFSEDDIVLECVILVGNLALSAESAQHIASSRLPAMLQDLLVEKHEDEEIVVQLLYAFECFLVFDEVRDSLLQDPELVPCMMRFSRARNPAVTKQAASTLESVAEYAAEALGEGDEPPPWIEQIKAFRFEQHNAEWCNYVNWELSGGSAGSPGRAHAAYYDDGSPSGDEEEEFAFHWAGGDAVDADDLANRDWESKGMDQFMHSTRFA